MNIVIDKNSGDSLYLQLYNAIKKEIVTGNIKPGDKLPSYRFITNKFNINISTVIKAYASLEEAGVIEIIQGSGCYAKALSGENFLNENAIVNSFNKGQVSKSVINFASGSPYIDTYPLTEFEDIFTNLFHSGFSHTLSYGDTQGYYELREALCKMLKEFNINIVPDNVQIINGSQQGLDLICKVIMKKGCNVVVENPGYTVAVNTFKNNGCNVSYVSVENDGINMEELKHLLSVKKIDFLYTTPNYQVPTGICWSNKKMRMLIKLAAEYNFLIIEDDLFSDLSFDGIPKPTLRSLDTNGEYVLYIKSFSKLIMPGLRLACLITPQRFIDRLIVAKFYTDISSSVLLQKSLADFLNNNLLSNHLSKLRVYYQTKCICMKEAIEQSETLCLENFSNGGLTLWVKIHTDVGIYDFYTQMKEEGIILLPGNVYSHTGTHGNFLRLGFAVPSNEAITEGIKKIDTALKNNFSKK